MKDVAENLIRELKTVLPAAETDIQELGPKSAWLDAAVPGVISYWEIEIRGNQFLVYSHYPNDPDDVAFAPPDDWFASLRAAALFLKSALTIRASDPQALGRFVLSAHKDSRERTYTFESLEDVIEFTSELIKQGVPSKEIAFYQQAPIPPEALHA